jgi:hypothetical protein
MKPAQVGGTEYDARIRRAQHLASQHPFAAEVLRFYSRVAEFQRDLCAKLPHKWGNQPLVRPDGRIRSELNLVVLLPQFPDWLDLVARSGPSELARAARQFSSRGSSSWIAAFGDFWTFGGRSSPRTTPEENETNPLKEFLLLGFLHPYCEFVAAHRPEPQLEAISRECPRCASRPLLGVLRPEGDGAKRRMLCSFCLQEWDFRRIYCPACGEEDEKKLPVYVAEQFPHVRVEACETCKIYVRTIDLTKDGNAVPVVDDLAAIPLSLWAHERGFTRLQPNLLGT